MNKFSIILFFILSTAFLSLFNSCVRSEFTYHENRCPEPLPIYCKPDKWNGKPRDTSISNKLSYYYKISKVDSINTQDDEWQISSVENNYFLTKSINKINSIVYINKVNNFTFKPIYRIENIENKHIGSISGNKSLVTVAIANIPNLNKSVNNYSDGFGFSRLFEGKLNHTNLDNIEEIKLSSNDSIWFGNPFYYYRNNVIFFASDLANGYGGTDIWYIHKSNGKWSQPINCGSNINTECDEITPYISDDGKYLYFSSAGHQTVGGYDIFRSEIKNKLINNNSINPNEIFGEAENLAFPINTINDELFPYGNEEMAFYYSSNQNKNDFDIYVYHKVDKNIDITKQTDEIDINKPKIFEVPIIILFKGQVLDKQTQKPIDSASIDIIHLKNNTSLTKLKTDKSGSFEAELENLSEYRITAQKDEFYFDSKDIIADTNLKNKIIIFDLPIRGEIRFNFPLDEFKTPYPYTLDSNGIETNRKWQDEIDLVADNIKMTLKKIDKVLLVGHTDDLASDEYNLSLGEKRVNFIINELVKRGIPRQVLFGRSAGKRELLTKKNNEDIEQYRKRLRRVTIEKILKK